MQNKDKGSQPGGASDGGDGLSVAYRDAIAAGDLEEIERLDGMPPRAVVGRDSRCGAAAEAGSPA